ncbi:MAG: hypothetical protein ACKVW3_13200 [Phycisphaerales bacterium]
MPTAFQVLVVLLFVALVVVAIFVAHRAEKRRRELLAALAGELGFTFDPARDRAHDERYAQFSVFRRGHSQAALNTMTGVLTIDDRRFSVRMGDFEYKITSSNGKTTTTRTIRLSYVILHLPFAGIPDFWIRPETFMDKLAGMIGIDDIDFESAEFSRKFHVKSADKRFAYDVIHPRMIEFLLANPTPSVDVERGCLCIADQRARWSALEFRGRLDFAKSFLGLWPDHITAALAPKEVSQA